ncbi:hypothetical protein ACFSHP_15545 [Novosphingobium panipatense]
MTVRAQLCLDTVDAILKRPGFLTVQPVACVAGVELLDLGGVAAQVRRLSLRDGPAGGGAVDLGTQAADLGANAGRLAGRLVTGSGLRDRGVTAVKPSAATRAGAMIFVNVRMTVFLVEL